MSAHNDSAFVRLFILILGALVAFTFSILFIASTVADTKKVNTTDAQRVVAKTLDRIQPIGQVKVAGAAIPTAAVAKTGDEIVAQACNSCHSSGILGAPKVGDQAAWEARLAQGIENLYQNAINGKGGMPARGGAADLSDEEIRIAVRAMLTNSGLPQ